MNRSFLGSASVLAALSLMAGPASAQALLDGAYASFFAGGNLVPEIATTTSGLTYDDGGAIIFDPGWIAGGALGANLAPNVRGEAELSYRHNGISSYVEGGSLSNIAAAGDFLSALSLMGNIWFELPVDGGTNVHLGGGLGASWLHLKLATFDDVSTFPVDSGVLVPAAQLGAGISHQLENGMAVTLDYRLFATTGATFTSTAGPQTISFGYLSHSVMAGVRIPLGN